MPPINAHATSVNGILLLYHHPSAAIAYTCVEHANAFREHSQFNVWKLNTLFGLPEELQNMAFRIIVLDYSLFAQQPFFLDESFREYLESCKGSYKIAFFQDEYRYWPERSAFLKKYDIDHVYTLLEPDYFDATYRKHVPVPHMNYMLPGYVGNGLLRAAKKWARPDRKRTIDVGYRARQLPYCLGRGAQEKDRIGVRFRDLAQNTGLVTDIETEEGKRLHGASWYKFLARCRAMLGVEAGVSVFDIDNEVYPAFDKLMSQEPNLTFQEVHDRLLQPYEDRIFYRTISPRHFEAAAFRVCQILFEGSYSGILKPMVHYLPLKKDLSNFDEIVEQLRNNDLRNEIVERAYDDLIASGAYTYERFIAGFDRELKEQGVVGDMDQEIARSVTQSLERGEWVRTIHMHAKALRAKSFPGRHAMRKLLAPLRERLRTVNVNG